MEIKKAEIKDLDIVVKMKMEMFTEVVSVSFLQDDAEKKIYEKYKENYDVIIIGKKSHPEVVGSLGWCDDKVVFSKLIPIKSPLILNSAPPLLPEFIAASC